MEISMINPLFWGGLITLVVSLYLAYDSRWRQLRGIGRHLQAHLQAVVVFAEAMRTLESRLNENLENRRRLRKEPSPVDWSKFTTRFIIESVMGRPITTDAFQQAMIRVLGIDEILAAHLSLFWYAASGAERYFEFRERALEADLKKYEEAESRNEGVVAIYDFSQFIPQQLEQALIHAEKAQALIDKLFYDKSAFMYRLVRRFHVPQSERDFLTQM